ncbi:MAG: flavodoxin domain-containing protein, partial [Clostridium sp.]|nr:flavodoxin domain-containing protein [Clostridium sp.]
MSKMAVIYWSQTGNTQAMAEAIAAGAQEAGADVTLTDVSKITADEALTYDYLALGCPS